MSNAAETIHVCNISDREALEGLVHVTNFLLLHMAAMSLDDATGQSSLLNHLLMDMQNCSLPDRSKELILGMIASCEERLRTYIRDGR
jgi:hypothetical protein